MALDRRITVSFEGPGGGVMNTANTSLGLP